MALLRDFIGQTLQWKRPRFFSTDYELRAEDQIIATMKHSGVWKRRTIAEAEGSQWTFRRAGLSGKLHFIYAGALQPAEEPAQPLGSFKRNWHGDGELTIVDGRSYTWARTGTWNPTWSWKDAYSTILLSMKRRRLVEIAPEANDSSDLALLTLFGFYLVLVKEAEAAAAAS